MAEYIVVSVPDEKDLTCFDCERDACAEVGCPHAPSVVTARPKECIVRCGDCKHLVGVGIDFYYCELFRAIGEYDFELHKPAYDGFCSWGERKEGE